MKISKKELSRISLGAAYSIMGRDMQSWHLLSSTGKTNVKIHLKQSYLKMHQYIIKKHCDYSK